MKKFINNSVLHVGMKIMGIYFFSQAFMVVPQIFTHIAMVVEFIKKGKFPDYYQIHPYWYLLALGLSFLIMLMIGYFLAMKTDNLIRLLKAPDKIIKLKTRSGEQSLKIWIIILGFYLFVTSIPGFLKSVWDYLNFRDRPIYTKGEIVTNTIGLVVAGLMIFFSKIIVDFLKRIENKYPRYKK